MSTETPSQPTNIRLDEFIETTTNAVLRAIEARRIAWSGNGEFPFPTTTVGLIFDPKRFPTDFPLQKQLLNLSMVRGQSLTPDSDARLFAQAAGELHGAIVRQIQDELAVAKSTPNAITKKSLEELQHKQMITEDEHVQLNMLVDTVAGIDVINLETVQSVRKVYTEFVDNEASPVALAIASIAVNSAIEELTQTVGAATRGQKAMACVKIGLGGAALGARYGGLYGALIGGVVGCAVGAIAEAL